MQPAKSRKSIVASEKKTMIREFILAGSLAEYLRLPMQQVAQARACAGVRQANLLMPSFRKW